MSELVTQCELNDLLDIVVDCVKGKSLKKIRDATWKFGQLVGADRLYWAVPVFGENGAFAPTPVVDFNISYPAEWVHLYKEEKLVTQDPVGQICMTGRGVHYWGDITTLIHFKQLVGILNDAGMALRIDAQL